MLNEYDVVESTRQLSENVPIRSRGTVVMVYRVPRIGYEVEFINGEGGTLDVLTVYEDDVRLIQSFNL